MKHRVLRDSAKFLAGLVLGDFLSLWWMAAQGLLPIHFLGVTLTSQVIAPGLLFDAALILILIHYGWNVGKIPAFRERTYLTIAGVIFALVTLLHLARLFTGAVILDIFGWDVPLWLSWFGVVIAAYLSYMSFSFAKKLS